jgi:hypothetical protein
MARKLDAYFKVFITKMEVGTISAAYMGEEKKSIEERLDLINPEDRREYNYMKYVSNPKFCTEDEIKDAKLYMYLNDMMTDMEEEEFEKESGLA